MQNDSSPMACDVAIVGGGMVGMSLAVALAREGMSIALIEKSRLPDQLEPTFDGRVSAIAQGSKIILENIGVWQEMGKEAQLISDIRVSDGDSPFFLHYDHHEIGEAPFGYIVENRFIRHAMYTAAKADSRITFYENTYPTSIARDDSGCNIILQNHTLRCRVLIGADGKHSPVRDMLGIEAVSWPYSQTAIVCTIRHEKPHHGLAQERFLPAGPFAVLPMTDNRSSLVWVEPEDRASLYLDLPPDEFVQEITERVGDYLGKITVEGDRFFYPLSLMHAKTYVSNRAVLAGDAAHAIHPIAGQGVNLGFRDVAVLAELLGERFKLGMDIGADDLLAHYQRWRRFDNTTMLVVTDGLNRLFSNQVLPVKLARGLGLWAVSKMPPVKRFFMRHAMGMEGDMPKLMIKTN